jgi:hypothetical protein
MSTVFRVTFKDKSTADVHAPSAAAAKEHVALTMKKVVTRVTAMTKDQINGERQALARAARGDK